MDKQEKYMQNYVSSVQGFNKTVRDIDHRATVKETVGNRPYATILTIAAILVFIGLIMPTLRIPMFIAAAVLVVILYLIPNQPIIKIYDGFLVLFNYVEGKDNPRVAIIPDENLVSWEAKSTIGYNTIFKYMDNGELKVIGLNSINFQGCTSALNKHYHDKLETIVKLTAYKKEMSKSKKSFGEAVKSLVKLNEDSKKAEKEKEKENGN